jgi:predicted aspartyl protease
LRGSGEGLVVMGEVLMNKIKFVIDTGSGITIISTKKYREMNIKPSLDRFECEIILADGSPMSVRGQTEVAIGMGQTQFNHRVVVADISTEALLGMDFLEEHGCLLDIKKRCLRVKGTVLPLYLERSEVKCSRISAIKSTMVPPRHEQLIEVRLHNTLQEKGKVSGLIEQVGEYVQQKGLVVAKTLVDMGSKNVHLRVMNLTEEVVELRKNTVMGICQPIEGVVDKLDADQTRCRNVEMLDSENTSDKCTNVPEHLQDLVERCRKNLSSTEVSELEELLMEYRDIFQIPDGPLGKTNKVKHEINTGNNPPVKQRPHRLSWHKRETCEKEIKDMLEKKIIEPSSSPWAAPIVLVKKKDGSTRFCIDYRKLNDCTVKDAYPIPRIEDSLNSLSGAKYFSTLDLASGYWQVEMAEKDKEKTAFTTHLGLYQFTVMPFGLCNAPSTFERLMENTLSGLQYSTCLIYLDDIIIFASDFQAEMTRIRAVFDRLREAGMMLKAKKCDLFQKEVTYLGHKVSDKGVEADSQKVEAVKNWPVPNSVKEVRSFLGLCSYYRRFVQGFATIASPLHKLTEKSKTFEWSDECEVAFNTLKTKLCEAPILAYPNFEHDFILDTDASNFGLGGVLSQNIEDKEHVIAYGSRSLTKPERRYCVTRRELLAVVHFVKHFKHFLVGRNFLLRTDHGALRWLFKFKEPEGQVARWIEVLNTYQMDIHHRPGKQHGNADALSRMPCKQCGIEDDVDGTLNPDVVRVMAVTRAQAGQEASSTPVESENRKEDTVNNMEPEQSGNDKNWCLRWSHDEIRTLQRTDPVIGMILGHRQSEHKPKWAEISDESTEYKTYWGMWDQLIIRDGVLYKRWESDSGHVIKNRLAVPRAIKLEILRNLHDCPSSGHLGQNKTEFRVRERFFWFEMREDVDNYVRQCDECEKRKAPPKPRRAPLQQYRVGAPMERIAIDIVGPLTRTFRGNQYILCLTDYFSKWAEAYPMRNMEAPTVARKLVDNFVSRFGAPRAIHTDQGRQFESHLFQELCKILGIEKTRTCGYNPKSDG